ncbi:hypothetical protein FRC12_007326 [Ceratobasidium sp. 428]|nr:hypothetical protein FRC12_007326 [Ceratobasidium sp. 428]
MRLTDANPRRPHMDLVVLDPDCLGRRRQHLARLHVLAGEAALVEERDGLTSAGVMMGCVLYKGCLSHIVASLQRFWLLHPLFLPANVVSPGRGGTNLDPAKLAGSNVHFIYNWETWCPAKTTNLNWIGMQATKDSASSPIGQLQTRAAQQGWNTVFSLNEPDINGISAGDAANWYIQNINPLAIKKAIPAVTSSQNAGQGLDWAAAFISACAGRCCFDYVNIHWYGSTFAQFQSHVQNAHSWFPNYQLVVSEFALIAPASRDQQVAFLKSAMSFLDGAAYVTYYSVFGASSPSLISQNTGGGQVGTGSSLFNDDGSLTANGIAYRG